MLFIKQALLGAFIVGAASAASVAFASTASSHALHHAPAKTAAAAVTVTAASAPSVPDGAAGVASLVAGAAPLDRQTLASYAHLSGPMRIAGESATQTVTVPISPREAVRSVMLHLVATNSVSLLNQRSQLVVRMDDRTIAQFPLSPLQPELSADIQVPAALLRAGYNNLSFSVAQHATNECEEKDSPELWTEIDTSNSTLKIDTELKPLTQSSLTLADIADLIDPRQSSPSPLAIVMASHPKSDAQIASGGLLAQGIALRLRYLNAKLNVKDAQAGTGVGILPGLSLSPVSGADVVLVGTRDLLKPYVDAKIVSRIDGAFLAIYPKPDDPRHFVLIVSGRNDDELNLAAKTFAHAEIPLPNKSDMIVRGFPDVQLSDHIGSKTLQGTGAFTFRDLGFNSTTLGAGDSADLKVRLAGDVYASEDANVQLTLNFAEGAKMRSDSVLNVYLNGQFERALALDQEQGAVVNHYHMPIPLRHFRPGDNTITLRPVLIPLITDRCTLRQSGNLQLSFFDNSSVRLPTVSHFATMPDLQRLATTGFPYVANGSGAGLAVQIKSLDNDTLAAAWSLVGKLAQDIGQPLTDAQMTAGAALPGRNTIVVGAQGNVPASEFANAPWSPGKFMRIPVAGVTSGATAQTGFWRNWFNTADAQDDEPTNAPHAVGSLVLNGDFPLSRQLLVMQYRGDAHTTTTLITAATSADMATGVAKLIDPQYWNNLAGDVGVLSFDDTTLWSAQLGPRYNIGHIDPLGRVGYEISRHPWRGYAALVLGLLLLATLSSILLRRYKRKHHGNADK